MGNTTGQGQPPISSCLHCLHYSFKGSKRGAHTAKLLLALEAATAQATGELVWANLHHIFLLCTMHQQQPLCSAWGTLGATGGKSTFCWEPGEPGPNALTSVCVHLLSRVRLCVPMDRSMLGFPVLHHLPVCSNSRTHLCAPLVYLLPDPVHGRHTKLCPITV